MHGSVPTLTYMSTLCVHLPSPSVTPLTLSIFPSCLALPDHPLPVRRALSSQLHIGSLLALAVHFPHHRDATPAPLSVPPPPPSTRRDRCPDDPTIYSHCRIIRQGLIHFFIFQEITILMKSFSFTAPFSNFRGTENFLRLNSPDRPQPASHLLAESQLVDDLGDDTGANETISQRDLRTHARVRVALRKYK